MSAINLYKVYLDVFCEGATQNRLCVMHLKSTSISSGLYKYSDLDYKVAKRN